jgi:type I restriction enzyme S subunit
MEITMPNDLLYRNKIIGHLPTGWVKVKVDNNLVDILGGFSCGRRFAVPSGIPHLRPMNITANGELVVNDDTVYIPPDFKEDIENYSLQKWDILYNNTNSVELVGKTAIVREPLAAAFSNHINRLRVRNPELIDPRWLALALRSLQAQGFFAANCNKWIGQAGFSVSELAEVEIPLPDIRIQRRIVARIEALLSEVREAKLFNADIKADADKLIEATLNEILILPNGRLPTGWTRGNLEDFAHTTSGGTPSRNRPDYYQGSISWFKSGELNDGFLNDSEEKITEEAIHNSNAKLFPAGTLLIAMYGATAGKLGILTREAATNQAICAVFPDESQVIRDYLFWYLLWNRRSLIATSKGGAQPNLNQQIIRQLEVHFPEDISVQERIVSYLKKIQVEVADIKNTSIETSQLLNALEQSIVAQAFIGEL